MLTIAEINEFIDFATNLGCEVSDIHHNECEINFAQHYVCKIEYTYVANEKFAHYVKIFYDYFDFKHINTSDIDDIDPDKFSYEVSEYTYDELKLSVLKRALAKTVNSITHANAKLAEIINLNLINKL